MRVVPVFDLSGLEGIADSWRGLVDEMVPLHSPFVKPDIAVAWWKTYGRAGTGLFVLGAVDDGGKLRGILPLYRRRKNGERQLLPLLAPLHNDRWSVVAQRDYEHDVAKGFAAYLAADKSWDVLILNNVPEGSPATDAFLNAAGKAGLAHYARPSEPCVSLDLSGLDSIEGLVRRSRIAGLACRAAQRLEDDFQATYSWERPTASLMTEIASFERDCASGFARGTSFFSRAGAEDFMRAFSETKAFAEDVVVALIRIEGRIVAHRFQFRESNEIQTYFIGFNAQLKAYQPGNALTYLAIRSSLEEKCDAHNFLLGDDFYKRRWGALPMDQQLTHIVFNRSMGGRFFHFVRRAAYPLLKKIRALWRARTSGGPHGRERT